MRTEWALDQLYLHVDMNNAAAVALYESIGYCQLPEYDSVCRSPRSGFAARSGAPAARNRYHCKSFELADQAAEPATAVISPSEPRLTDALGKVSPVGAVLARQST